MYIFNNSFSDTRKRLQGIGEVISPSIVKLKVLGIQIIHVYFPMNTKERHIMNVLRVCLDILMITFGVQQCWTLIINLTTGDVVVKIVPALALEMVIVIILQPLLPNLQVS